MQIFRFSAKFADFSTKWVISVNRPESMRKILGYGGGLATVNARSLFKGKISFVFATTELRFMKTSLFFRSHCFIENLQLKRKSAKEQRKKKRNCRLSENNKAFIFGWFSSYISSKRLPMRLLRNMAKKHSGFWRKKSSNLYAIFWFEE